MVGPHTVVTFTPKVNFATRFLPLVLEGIIACIPISLAGFIPPLIFH